MQRMVYPGLRENRQERSSGSFWEPEAFGMKGEANLELLLHSDLFDWRAPIHHKKVVSKRRRVRHCYRTYGHCHSFFHRA